MSFTEDEQAYLKGVHHELMETLFSLKLMEAKVRWLTLMVYAMAGYHMLGVAIEFLKRT